MTTPYSPAQRAGQPPGAARARARWPAARRPRGLLGDVAAPLKTLLPDYKAIEARVEAAVLGHFGLTGPLPACVKWADLCALASGQWQAPTLYPAEIVAIDEFARLHHWQVRQLSWGEYERATSRATGQITAAGLTVIKQSDLVDFAPGQPAEQFERKAA